MEAVEANPTTLCGTLGHVGSVGIRGTDVLRQDGAVQPPAGLPFDYPPAWNRALCRFIDAERHRFRGGGSIRVELVTLPPKTVTQGSRVLR